MENTKLPDGAQFLIIRDGQPKKVVAFAGMPIELNDLIAVNSDEESFLKEGRVGFVLISASKESASIKVLSDIKETITINFGEQKKVSILGTDLLIELWAVRFDSETPNNWRLSMI